MALSDHLRELRARILRSVTVLVVAFIVALFFYDQLLDVISRPYFEARHALGDSVSSDLVLSGVTTGLTLQLKLCGVAALIAASPYWLLQIWGFVVPGLHSNEKRWTYAFAAAGGPLFLIGVAVGYYVLPKGVEVLVGFTPVDARNLVDFNEFFGFVVRMLLVFGIAFEIPLFIIMLNLAGVVSGRALAKYRPWMILGAMIFAAVATPSTDPFSMLMLAIPLILLCLVAEVVARILDRRRARRRESTEQWGDDEVSPL